MVLFPNLICNVYPIFSIKFNIIIKSAIFKKKQIDTTLEFIYTKYKI